MKKLLVSLVVLLTSTASFAGDGITLLEDFAAKVLTAEGSFSQNVVDKQGKLMDQSSGKFAFSRPGKFIWNYEKPYEQQMICDGTDIWIWDPDLNQVTVKTVKNALPTSPAAILFGKSDIQQDWTVKDLPESEGMAWVELTPKHKEASYSNITFGFKGTVPEKLVFVGAFGEKSTLVFKDVKVGVSLKNDMFKFVPPKGADVLKAN